MRARIVFDTNVIVSALLFSDSIPGKAFFCAYRRGQFLLSLELAQEIYQTLGRKKFDKYISRDMRNKFMTLLIEASEWVEVRTRISICRDTKDNRVLEVAQSGKAQVIVTGDLDLLVLNPFGDVAILRPQEFVQLYCTDELAG